MQFNLELRSFAKVWPFLRQQFVIYALLRYAYTSDFAYWAIVLGFNSNCLQIFKTMKPTWNVTTLCLWWWWYKFYYKSSSDKIIHQFSFILAIRVTINLCDNLRTPIHPKTLQCVGQSLWRCGFLYTIRFFCSFRKSELNPVLRRKHGFLFSLNCTHTFKCFWVLKQ